jgi:hypothetical protein
MKKLLLTVVLFVSLVVKSMADEGMWLPLLLGQQVYDNMKKKGLILTKEQLYSINKPSLKDAILILEVAVPGRSSVRRDLFLLIITVATMPLLMQVQLNTIICRMDFTREHLVKKFQATCLFSSYYVLTMLQKK